MHVPSQQSITITKRDLQDIVAESVDTGVGRAFTRLGINHESPLDMQADFRHLRASRETVRAIKAHALKVATTAIVGGLVAYLAIGFTLGDSNTSAKPQFTQEELGAAIVQMYRDKYVAENQ